jgi:hypothetical protein
MKNLKRLPLFLAGILALAGCGPSSTPSSSSGSSTGEAHVSGVVLGEEGPAPKAKVEAKDRNGALVAQAEASADAHYRLNIPAGAAYPLVLTAMAEGEPAPLKAIVTSDLVADQDISPVTTLVVDTALSLGGLTEANLAKAAGAAIAQRKTSGGSGGSAGFKGDPTKQYGGWH